MKKLLLVAAIIGTSTVAAAQEITFAMEPSYPPFELTNEKGEIIGFDVDIANAICQEIQATCHFQSQSFRCGHFCHGYYRSAVKTSAV